MRDDPNHTPRAGSVSRADLGQAAPFAIVLLGLPFWCFPWLFRVFAWPWVVGRADVLGWWPVHGLWHWVGIGALFLTILIAAWCYSVGKSSRAVLIVTVAGIVIALGFLFWGGRSRIEVRAHDIRVTSDRWGEADALYRIDNAAGMTAACWIGSKGRAYPSLWVWFHDGRELELERLTSRDANPGATRAGLDFAEGLDIFLVHHSNRRSARVSDRCVEQIEDRLDPADAPRIGALFAREMVEVPPDTGSNAESEPLVIDMTPR